jgi:protein-disulfide isomerase
MLAFSFTAQGAETLFKLGGKNYQVDDLAPKFKTRFYEAEKQLYHIKEAVINEVLLDLYFEDLAKSSKKTVDAVRAEQLKTAEPSDKEIKDFYESNKARIPYPYDQVKGELARYVKEQKTHEKQMALVEKVKKDKKFALSIKEPAAPKIDVQTAGFVNRGKNGAKVTVVEFADYKCGHCKEASKVFKKLYEEFDEKVNFVFIDFPIIHGSEEIAKGSHCAKEQNKYWEYHSLAFEKQGDKEQGTPTSLAKAVGLDEGKFQKCMKDEATMKIVKRGKEEGERLGVAGTPAIFINGERVHEPSYAAISAAINEKLR